MITNKDELQASVDIVDVISSYIDLKKNGANYKACCPFHSEDTPSFVVNAQKGIYKCFGCGAGGDVIKFVQEYKKLNFIEALEEIANITNFTLIYDKNYKPKDYKQTIEAVNSFYKSNAQSAKEYLYKRGITDESIEKFELGYAPNTKEQIQSFQALLINQDELREIGILTSKEGKTYARITKRLTFPIRNHLGKLVGFSGRILPNDKREAKYLNSPQSKLFDKSKLLYGYDKAKDNIYKKGVMVVVEGHLDVVLMHQAGFNTCVGTQGTALTKDHALQLIKKTNAKVLLCFDGDKAGREALFKASKLLSNFEIDGGVVIFEDGLDPADMIQQNKQKELIKMLKNPIPLIEYILFYIKSNFNLQNPHEKNKCLKECQAFLKTLNPVIADEYVAFLANLLHINPKHVSKTQKKQHIPTKNNYNIAELNIIASALNEEHLYHAILKRLTTDMFITHTNEFEILKTNPKELQWIFCIENVRPYNGNELRSVLEIFKEDYKNRENLKYLFV